MSPHKIAHFDETALAVKVGGFEFSTTVKLIQANWNNLTHFPDRRARLELGALADRLNAFANVLAGLAESGGQIDVTAEAETFARRHVELTRAYWARESRCASWFICGPANFPVASNEKRQKSADKARQEIAEHEKAARKAVHRKAWPHGEPGGPIRGDNPDATELLREKIERRKKRLSDMKETNLIIRKCGKGTEREALIDALCGGKGLSRSEAAILSKPNCFGKIGYEPWEFANLRAEIKRLENLLAEIEAKRSRPPRDTTHETIAGKVEVIENAEADRIQIIFPGKPDAATRDALKGNGFRWAPSAGAWQRHLNNAGRDAVERVLRQITIKEAAA